MDKKKILVVEDEKAIADILVFNLGREGYDTMAAYDGAEGLHKALTESPDLILLDVMLPEMDGFEVCRRVRAQSDIPIIMLTAREEEADKVMGLELGADDYITKPFSMRELMARVKANMRRTLSGEEREKPQAEAGTACASPVRAAWSTRTGAHSSFPPANSISSAFWRPLPAACSRARS